MTLSTPNSCSRWPSTAERHLGCRRSASDSGASLQSMIRRAREGCTSALENIALPHCCDIGGVGINNLRGFADGSLRRHWRGPEGFTSPERHTSRVWGERAVGGFFEDLHVLIVVVLGMSILMGSLAAAYVAYQEARESTARRAEAGRILRAVLDDERLVHDGQAALFDLGALERLDAAELRRAAGADPGIQLVVSEQN